MLKFNPRLLRTKIYLIAKRIQLGSADKEDVLFVLQMMEHVEMRGKNVTNCFPSLNDQNQLLWSLVALVVMQMWPEIKESPKSQQNMR